LTTKPVSWSVVKHFIFNNGVLSLEQKVQEIILINVLLPNALVINKQKCFTYPTLHHIIRLYV